MRFRILYTACFTAGILACFTIFPDQAIGQATGNTKPTSSSLLRRLINLPASSSARDTRDALFPRFLQNASFDIPGSGGNPASWEVFRSAFSDTNPSFARTGTTSVRSSFLYGYFQQLESTVSPLETLAVSGYASREFDYEKPGIRLVTYDSGFRFLKELNGFSPADSPQGFYGRFWVSQTLPASTQYLQIFLRGEMANSWPRFDDLSLYTEQLTSSTVTPVGEPWNLEGGTQRNGDSIDLPSGAILTQDVATGSEPRAYFISAHYQADAETTLTVVDQWKSRSSIETALSTSTVHRLIGSGQFLSDPGRPGSDGSGWSRISLMAEGSTISLTRIRRGFAMVEPQVFTGGPASVDSPLLFTAAWPDYLTSASVEILSGTQVLATVSPALQGTAFQAGWPGALTAPTGHYTARFHLQAADGDTVLIDRPFSTVQDGASAGPVPSVRYNEFLKSTWIFVNGQPEARIQQALQLAKSDGFNAAFICCDAGQLPLVRQYAEAVDLKFILFVPNVLNRANTYLQGMSFSKAEFLPFMHTILDGVSNSPQYLGIYLTDGMTSPDGFEVTRKMLHAVSQDGTLGQPWFLPDSNLSQANLDLVQPPTVLIGIYPYIPTSPDPVKALLNELPGAVANVHRAAAAQRDLWYIVQAFSDGSNRAYYALPSSYHFAQQAAAVMAGARGVSSFLFSSNSGQTQRDWDFVPYPILEGYQKFNAVMDRISLQIMQLSPPDLISGIPSPFAVSVAATSSGEKFVHVLNADGAVTRTLKLAGTNFPSGNLHDIVGLRDLPRAQDESIIITLEPGGWALFSIGNGGAVISGSEMTPPPGAETIVLDMLYQFSPVRDAGGIQPANGVQFSPDGGTLAVSVGAYSFEGSRPQFYSLMGNGAIERVNGPVQFPSEVYRAVGDYYQRSSAYLGVDFNTPATTLNTPVARFSGYSGGAEDALVAGGNTWISLGNMGMRRLASGTGNLVSVETAPTGGFGAYTQLFGPFDDGSVTAVVEESLLRNFKIGSMSNITFTQMRGIDAGGAMSSARKIAVPRHSHGLGLVQSTGTGELTVGGNIQDGLWDVTAAAWVSDHILAVADAIRGVFFYRITAENTVERLGWWKVPGASPEYITGLDSRGDKLAVSTYQGNIYVLDSSQLGIFTAVKMDWQLFE